MTYLALHARVNRYGFLETPYRRVEKIKAVGEKFDVATMEVVEKPGQSKSDQDLIVTKVRKNGYLLNGEVIRHAKVVVS